jgi:hypothetical protein
LGDQRGKIVSKLFWVLIASTSFAGTNAGAQSNTSGSPRAAQEGANAVHNVPARAATAPDSSGTYDAQALRFETSWGNVKIIRGIDGSAIGTSGWFRDFDLEKLLARSPAAVTEAQSYNASNSRGSFVAVIGAVTTSIGILVTANGSNNAASPILIIGGVGAMAWGAQHLSMSYAALSRAFWLYNRDLAH